MATELRIPEIERTGKYLGIPSDWGTSKRQMFGWILGRVHAKLEGWKEKLISKAGKEVLLKAVVQALPQYAMSIFKISVSICKAIEQRIARFWWKNSVSQTGLHWKKWDTLKLRKDKGGMGFRDLQTMNNAMLGKQAWRLTKQPEALWSRTFKGLYFHQRDFWHAERGARPSWGWQSIITGREAISSSVRWSIGNGRQVNIRTDRWLTRGVIGGPARRNDPQLVAELINVADNQWDLQKLEAMFDEQTNKEILAIHINPQQANDELIWTGTKSGELTVKAVYNQARHEADICKVAQPSPSVQPPSSLWNTIWKLRTYPKVKFFMWSACQNAMATKENLWK